MDPRDFCSDDCNGSLTSPLDYSFSPQIHPQCNIVIFLQNKRENIIPLLNHVNRLQFYDVTCKALHDTALTRLYPPSFPNSQHTHDRSFQHPKESSLTSSGCNFCLLFLFFLITLWVPSSRKLYLSYISTLMLS